MMQNNRVLKRLLTVAASAAMFSASVVHAQTSGSSGTSGQANMNGQTTSQGTVGNTNSDGQEENMGTPRGAATQGSTSQGSSSAGSAESAGNPAVSGTSGSSAGAGATTREGTVGNTGSQGMESREPSRKDEMSGSSGSQGATAAGATATGAAALSKGDERMVKDMAQANIAEIEGGKLAVSKTQNDQVKSFAQQMIDDHTKALGDVQSLAQQKGVTLPTEPDASHKAMATKLQAMSGEAFDKAYIAQAGVSDHKKVRSMLLGFEKKAKDPDVKAAASKMAPLVEQHLKSAQAISASKSAAATTSGK